MERPAAGSAVRPWGPCRRGSTLGPLPAPRGEPTLVPLPEQWCLPTLGPPPVGRSDPGAVAAGAPAGRVSPSRWMSRGRVSQPAQTPGRSDVRAFQSWPAKTHRPRRQKQRGVVVFAPRPCPQRPVTGPLARPLHPSGPRAPTAHVTGAGRRPCLH